MKIKKKNKTKQKQKKKTKAKCQFFTLSFFDEVKVITNYIIKIL